MNIWELDDKDLKKAAKHLKKESRLFPKKMQRQPNSSIEKFRHRSSVPLIEIWRSNKYLCQIYQENEEMQRLSICRTVVDTHNRRWRDGLSWDELQIIKSEVGRGHLDAVEVYPRDLDVVNVANLRHLWVFKNELPFAWRSPNTLKSQPTPNLKPGGIF